MYTVNSFKKPYILPLILKFKFGMLNKKSNTYSSHGNYFTHNNLRTLN